jgi:hypothetical protein
MLGKKLLLKSLALLSGLLMSILLFFPCPLIASDYKMATDFPHCVSPGESLSKIARLYLPLTAAYTIKDLIESAPPDSLGPIGSRGFQYYSQGTALRGQGDLCQSILHGLSKDDAAPQ